MKKLILSCIMLTLTLSLAASSTGCYADTRELPEVSLDEASDILGVNIPALTYLPKGYEIRKVYLEENIVTLIISGEQVGADLQWGMKISIVWNSSQIFEPMELPFARIEIDDDTTGFIMQRETVNELWWEWPPDPKDEGWFEFMISAEKAITAEEMVKVAKGMEIS